MDSVNAWFTTTHWSVVLFAGSEHESRAQKALALLCEAYRGPLLSFARRVVPSHGDAEDFTQAFFAHLIQSDLVRRVQQRHGVKFRSFLLTCFKNFLRDQRQKELAGKRGGGLTLLSLDEPFEIAAGPFDRNSPDILYDREWASALLATVLQNLQAEYDSRGKGAIYDSLREHLVHQRSGSAYQELAQRLGVTPEAVRKEVSRMRQRYRELFSEEIVHTVSHPSEVQEEVRYLMRVLSS